MLKQILLLTLFTVIFTVLIFLGKLYTLPINNQSVLEENLLLENKYDNNTLLKEVEKDLEFSSAQKVQFLYIPKDFEEKTTEYKKIFLEILESKVFQDKISNIKIEFHKEKPNVRGNMKNKTLKLFGILDIRKEELISVSIHELAHYIDLYFFEVKEKDDASYKFYNISWETYKIIKKGQTIKDFVSGYAMSNKYEDFAESFTYFVLHNNDFLEKSKKSSTLQKKYDFFKQYLFKNNVFIGQDFSNEEIKLYYWDITKINISLEKFLQYLKK